MSKRQIQYEAIANKLAQIEVMRELAENVHIVRGGNLGDRLMSDLDRISTSGWLNLYEYLSENGVSPDEHFKKD